MSVRFVAGEYLVVAENFTRSKPHKWLDQEVLWHETDTTLAEAMKAADRFRATHETSYRCVGMFQATADPTP